MRAIRSIRYNLNNVNVRHVTELLTVATLLKLQPDRRRQPLAGAQHCDWLRELPLIVNAKVAYPYFRSESLRCNSFNCFASCVQPTEVFVLLWGFVTGGGGLVALIFGHSMCDGRTRNEARGEVDRVPRPAAEWT